MSNFTMHEAFAAAVAKAPTKIAVLFEGLEITYESLSVDVRRLSDVFQNKVRLPVGSRVGILLSNRPEYFVAVLAISHAGLVVVPVPTSVTMRELEYFVEDSAMSLLITEEAAIARLGDGAEKLVSGGLLVHGWEQGHGNRESVEELIKTGDSNTDSPIESDEVPFMFAYTSGTTGKPKAAVISQRARTTLALLHGQEYGCYTASDTTLVVTPMYHSAGMSRSLVPLITGGTVVIHRRFDAEQCVRALAEPRITGVFMVPTMFAAIFELGPTVTEQLRSRKFTILSNAAAMPHHLKRRILDAWPEVRLFEIYGSTEAGTATSLRPEDQLRKDRCVGPALGLTEIRLLDESGAVVNPGKVGEIAVRSPFAFSGYFGKPEATDSAFLDGFVLVGDLAWRDDEGYLYIIGRRSEVIITGGVNVYPREVEEVVAAHHAVREVAIVGVPDDYWGEKVHAVLVLKDGASLDLEELQSYCRDFLGAQKIPRSMEIRNSLPRTGTGKIAKHLLREGVTG
jgi:long-chain acyl-CoA synthetase